MKSPLQEMLIKLQSVFPDAVVETQQKDDEGRPYYSYALKEEFIKQLQDNLGSAGDQNRYELQFPGKSAAKAQAYVPSYKTLVVDKDQSKNFDSTNNVFIEGDNLDALRMLQRSYQGKIKVIYIDPPYNTGGDDFLYKDNFSVRQKEYLKEIGVLDEDGVRQISEIQNGLRGRFHAGWLTMMYPRLKLARELLSDDGVIFISIDDNEQANLKLICDEIFGEENFVASLTVVSNLKGNNDEFGFAGTHEYALVYTKDKLFAEFSEFEIDDDNNGDWMEDEISFYKRGANLKSTGQNAPRYKRPNLYFPVFLTKNNEIYVSGDDMPRSDEDEAIWPITDNMEMSWRWSKNKFQSASHEIIIQRNKSGNSVHLYKKQRPLSGSPSSKPKTLFYKPEYSSSNGTAQLKTLFNNRLFANPKPLSLIKDFVRLVTRRDSIILDFFVGSATTADAVMRLNAEDYGNRKFIMVQWAEDINPKKSKDARKFCMEELNRPATIAEIAKERIRRAGAKIHADNPDKQIDDGFRVFTVQDSLLIDNNSQRFDETEQLELIGFKTNLTKENFEPLLYEAILQTGVTLDLPIVEQEIDGYPFAICARRCYCVTENLTQLIVQKIIEQYSDEFDTFYYLSDCPAPTTSYTELESAVKLASGNKKIEPLNFY